MTTFNIGGVPEHFNLPWHLAIAQGLFEQNGVRLNWTDYPGGTGAMTNDLHEDILDIAIVLTEGIVADIAKGGQNRIVQAYVESPLIWGIHTGAHSAIKSVADLQGKRYAISRMGSGSHLMAFVDARQRGWDPQGQQLVIVNNLEGARKAFAQNEADAFMWEKFTTKPLVDSGEFRLVGECLTPWPCFMIAARQDVTEKHELALKAMLDVINGTAQAFMQNPDAVAMVAERYGLQTADAATWFKATHWATHNQIETNMLAHVVDTLFDLGVIPTKPALENLCASTVRLIK